MAKVDYGTLPPLPSRDANGRFGATRIGKALDFTLREATRALADGALVAPGTALPGWPDLVLVDAAIRPPPEGESAPQLVETYAEATSTWTQVGPDIEDRELNGLLRVRRTFVAKSGTAAPALEVGASSGPGTTVLASTSTGGSTQVVSRLNLTYLEPGQLAQSDDYSNNGKLHIRSITSFGQIPGTPSGFTLIGTQASDVEGVPTRVYRFAKGDGEISRDPGSRYNGKLLTVAIRHLTAPGVAISPITAPDGYALVDGPSKSEQDGHLLWSASFAKGDGEISRSTSGRDDGTVVTIRHLSAAATETFPVGAPSGFVLIDGPDMQEADGHRVWTASFAKGNDVIDTELNGLRRRIVTAYYTPGTVPGGSLVVGTTAHPTDTTLILARLRETPNDVTVKRVLEYLQPGIVSKSKGGGPASLPGTLRHTWQVWHLTAAASGIPGIITDEDEDNVVGYPVRRITSISSAGSGSPAGTLATFPTTLEITRHGTAEVAVSSDTGGDTPYLVLTPPRSGRIAATVTVELTTTPAAPVPVAFNLDNLSVTVVSKTRTRRYAGSDPSESIAGHVYAEQINMEHTTLRGYIYVASGSNGVEQKYEYPSAVNADGDTIAGEAFFSFIYSTITLTGSTTAPASTGLYSRDVDPVFTASDGTKWYRVTTISI